MAEWVKSIFSTPFPAYNHYLKNQKAGKNVLICFIEAVANLMGTLVFLCIKIWIQQNIICTSIHITNLCACIFESSVVCQRKAPNMPITKVIRLNKYLIKMEKRICKQSSSLRSVTAVGHTKKSTAHTIHIILLIL